jgi:carbon-monoxide dehydrogenase medium subunit
MASYDYVAPTTTDEVVRLLAEHGEDAHVIAGGASMLLMLQQQLIVPSLLVGLRGVEGLGSIREIPDGGLEIGAMATHRSVERSPVVRAYAPTLAEAVAQVATVRVRNQGTIGGNLAHADPAQDPPPILLALDASVEALGPDGPRSIPIDELFVDIFETSLLPAEIITAVRLPARPAGSAARYVKFLPRSKDDYATVAVAVSGVSDGGGRWWRVRVAAGAAGPVPLRIHDAEAALEGKAFDDDVVERAAEAVGAAVDPIPDHRGSAEYKREMAMVWTRRALRDLAARRGERMDA